MLGRGSPHPRLFSLCMPKVIGFFAGLLRKVILRWYTSSQIGCPWIRNSLKAVRRQDIKYALSSRMTGRCLNKDSYFQIGRTIAFNSFCFQSLLLDDKRFCFLKKFLERKLS